MLSAASIRRLSAFSGLGFFVAAVLAGICLGLLGISDQATPEATASTVADNTSFVGLAAFFAGVAGLCIVAFIAHLDGQYHLPILARFAGLLWATTWIIGATIMVAAIELAGWYEMPIGSRLVLSLGYLFWVSPLTGLLGGTLALGVSMVATGRVATWSLIAGGLALALSALGAVGGIGLAGMLPFVIWWLGMSALTARPPSRAPHPTSAANG